MPGPYHPNYQPKHAEKFLAMLHVFGEARDHKELKAISMMYVFDMSYAREDIVVALGRVEREKGWR